MNNAYEEAQRIIDDTKIQLGELLDVFSVKTSEDEELYDILSHIIGRLTSASSSINYLNSPVKEGILQLDNSSKKYYIIHENGETSALLSCGNSLEIYCDDNWVIGRVEATLKGEYYFYGSDKPLLFSGMKVRKRIV